MMKHNNSEKSRHPTDRIRQIHHKCFRVFSELQNQVAWNTIKLRAIEHVPRYDAGFPRNDLRIISYKILGYSAVDQ